MADLLSRLRALREPIAIGIVGVGSIGKGLVFQSGITPGIRCVAVADVRLERAVAAARAFGIRHRVVRTLAAMHDAVRAGELAVCEDGELVARCEPARLLIEASNALAPARQFALRALEHGKHVVMMNAEADLTFGPQLMRVAQRAGLVYTSCDGDQPAVIARLVEELRLWGFELVMAGNIKGFLDRYADPTTIAPEADKRALDHKMCASYTDGTKLGVEMALIANGLGLRVDAPGMHGPRAATVYDVFDRFDFDALWRERRPVVDYLLGATPTGGVFAIGYTAEPFQQFTLGWFPPRMGPGPYYVFYRPYHLGHIEAMTTVAEAALDGRAVLQPAHGFRTNVYAYAKRALRRGERLDGIGGYACYGLIENCDAAPLGPGLPICLADGVTVERDVARDERLALDDVRFAADDRAHRFYLESVAQAAAASAPTPS